MKCEVKLYVAGKVFTEEVHARDYQEAREVALARNPNAKVVGVNAKFWCGESGQKHWEKSMDEQIEKQILLLAYAPLFLFLTWSLTFLLYLE